MNTIFALTVTTSDGKTTSFNYPTFRLAKKIATFVKMFTNVDRVSIKQKVGK
jgi:hypothetical protein